MNSEDIYSSLRGVTEAIQNFSFRSQEDMNEPLKRDSKKDDGDSVSIFEYSYITDFFIKGLWFGLFLFVCF